MAAAPSADIPQGADAAGLEESPPAEAADAPSMLPPAPHADEHAQPLQIEQQAEQPQEPNPPVQPPQQPEEQQRETQQVESAPKVVPSESVLKAPDLADPALPSQPEAAPVDKAPAAESPPAKEVAKKELGPAESSPAKAKEEPKEFGPANGSAGKTLEPRAQVQPLPPIQKQIQDIRIKNRARETDKADKRDKAKCTRRAVVTSFNISLITNIDPIKSSFVAHFRVYLEWLDLAAVGAEPGRASKELAAKLAVPELSIVNAIELQVLDRSAFPRIVNPATGHVAFSILYSATVQVKYDMSQFPFDSQWLTITMAMRARRDSDRTFAFQFCEVEELRGLDEWKAHSSFAECDLLEGYARITFGLLIQRLSRYYIVNVLLMLCSISTLVFTLYALDVSDYAERAKIFMSLALTQVTFKLTVENKLPKVAYSTQFDQYTLACQALLIMSALGNAVACELEKSDRNFALRIELIFGTILGATWLVWNLQFAIKAWLVKKVQPREAKALPKELNARHISSAALNETIGIPTISSMESLNHAWPEPSHVKGGSSGCLPSYTSMESFHSLGSRGETGYQRLNIRASRTRDRLTVGESESKRPSWMKIPGRKSQTT